MEEVGVGVARLRSLGAGAGISSLERVAVVRVEGVWSMLWGSQPRALDAAVVLACVLQRFSVVGEHR